MWMNVEIFCFIVIFYVASLASPQIWKLKTLIETWAIYQMIDNDIKVVLASHNLLLILSNLSHMFTMVVMRTFLDGRMDGRSDDGRGGVRDVDAL
jgi:hypothetical protein